MNIKMLGILIQTATEIIVKFSEAKRENSDGGEKITTKELVGMSAHVCRGWAQRSNEPMIISVNDLSNAYKAAGWNISE